MDVRENKNLFILGIYEFMWKFISISTCLQVLEWTFFLECMILLIINAVNCTFRGQNGELSWEFMDGKCS